MPGKSSDDPRRAEYLELCQSLERHVKLMRDFGMTPGNAWLARAEVNKMGQILSELEKMLDEIKSADA